MSEFYVRINPSRFCKLESYSTNLGGDRVITIQRERGFYPVSAKDAEILRQRTVTAQSGDEIPAVEVITAKQHADLVAQQKRKQLMAEVAAAPEVKTVDAPFVSEPVSTHEAPAAPVVLDGADLDPEEEAPPPPQPEKRKPGRPRKNS